MSTPRGAVLTLRWLGAVGTALAVVLTSTSLTTSLAGTHESVTTTAEPGVRVLEVEIDSGRVEVRRGGDTVRVVRETTGSWRPPETASERQGDVLRLTGSCQPAFLQVECSTSYTVTAPDDVELVLSSRTGQVVVEGGSAPVTATTSAGRVEMTGLESEEVTASTTAGEVYLEFAAAPTFVDASTSTGHVEVVVPDDGTAYDVQASSDVGAAQVTVPRQTGAERRIVARASVGAVEVRPSRPAP